MSNRILYKAQFKKALIYFKRYFFNSLGSFATFFLIFLLIFLGYKGAVGVDEMYGDGLANIITGYLLWMLALIAFSEIAYGLSSEAREGILEQIYMSPYGYTRVAVSRLVTNLLVELITFFVMTMVMMFVTGRSLNFDFISLFPLFVMFLFAVIGLSFAMGGLQILFKKVQSIMQVMQFVWVAAVAAPVQLGWTKLLPGTMASELVRQVTVQEFTITKLPLADIGIALVVGLAYLFLGWGIFKVCEKKAMMEGRLAQF